MSMITLVRTASRWEILAVLIAIFGFVSAGCNGGSSTPLPPPPPGTSGGMFITDFTNNSISGFGQGANCNCPPALYIHGGNTGLSGPMGIAADKAGNLYVANSRVGTITKYPGTGTGNISPSFAIGGLSQPIGVAVDSSGNLYVANSAVSSGVPSVQVYPRGSSVPSQTISGPSTALSTPSFITLDASNNIWVANQTGNSIEEFANSATGDVPPANIIAGTRTLLSAPQGIAFDALGRLYVAINNALGFSDAVLVFAPGATGNVKPVNILCGSATAVNNPTGIAVNSQGTLFVVNSAVVLSAGSLVIFAANNIGGGMNCNGTFPNAVVGGPSSTLLNPAGIALH
jgi:hypothetical protein